MGHIIYFYLEMFNQSSEYVHNNGIKELYPDVNGTQLCFIDSKSDTYVFDPINETVYAVPDCPDNIDGVLWDQNIFERAIFAIYSKSIIVTYIFVKYFVEGICSVLSDYIIKRKSHTFII
jgi:WD repeat-containing protein 19